MNYGALTELRTVTPRFLADGKVLVTGGFGQSGRGIVCASAEVYDPSSGAWTVTGSVGGARFGHIAIALEDGRVLVAGGFNSAQPAENAVTSAELYEPPRGPGALPQISSRPARVPPPRFCPTVGF